MSFVATAMVGGTAASVGGSIFSGLMGSSAASKQAEAIRLAGERGASDILGAVDKSNATAREFNDTARGDLSPFREFGVKAGTTLTDLLMGGGNVANMLKASPLFNFQSEMGTQNINRQLAARGLYGSGAGLQTLAQFNDQLVGEEGQRLTDRLFNLTQLGGNAANSMASMTNNTGLNMSNNIFSGGVEAANMRFNAALGSAQQRANATNMIGQMGQQAFGQVGNAVANYPMISSNMNLLNSMTKSFGGGGGGAQAPNASGYYEDSGLDSLSGFAANNDSGLGDLMKFAMTAR